LPYQAEQRTDSRLQKTTYSAPEIHSRNWLRRNEFTLRPLTDVSSSKMLRDARMTALTGCAAASCQRVNGRSGPFDAADIKGGFWTFSAVARRLIP